jgi:hypothetical protein
MASSSSSAMSARVSFEPCDTKDVYIHNFQDEFMDMKIHFQLHMMKGSMFIWVGLARPALSALNVALLSPFVSITTTSIHFFLSCIYLDIVFIESGLHVRVCV